MDQKEALKYLENYRILKHSIKMLKKQMDKIITVQGPKDLKGICYDEIRAPFPKDTTEEALEKLQDLSENLRKTQDIVDDIDSALSIIGEKDKLLKSILIEHCIYKVTLEDISKESGYSTRQLRRKKTYALMLFATTFVGISGLD